MDKIQRPAGIRSSIHQDRRPCADRRAAGPALAHAEAFLPIEPIDSVQPGCSPCWCSRTNNRREPKRPGALASSGNSRNSVSVGRCERWRLILRSASPIEQAAVPKGPARALGARQLHSWRRALSIFGQKLAKCRCLSAGPVQNRPFTEPAVFAFSGKDEAYARSSVFKLRHLLVPTMALTQINISFVALN